MKVALKTLPLVLIAASALALNPTMSPNDRSDLSDALIKIRAAPAWKMPPDELKTKGEILMDAIRVGVHLEPSEARELISELGQDDTDKPGSSSAAVWSKIYVFNRCYFAVPEWEKKSSLRLFGGWAGVPTRDELISPLYPLKISNKGELVLAEPFKGYYGSDYDYLAEFDFFLERYGPRSLASNKESPGQ